ncbi:MAG: hypothetical protein ACK4Q5_10380 [Saprospiraceae bacterium]
MDLQKAKIYLDKINREFGRMAKDPETITRIDVDIMLAHIRELYDACLSEKTEAAPPPTHKPAPPAPKAAEPAPPPPAVVRETPPPPPQPVVVVEPPKPAPAPPPPPPIVATEPAPSTPKVPDPEPVAPKQPEPAPVPKPVEIVVASARVSPETESLFEQKQARELSEKLAETPIPDLYRGIALNDRLLFQAELFGKDNQAMMDTLAALNGMLSFEQAKAYLVENVIVKYEWADKKRADRAKEFIRLVRRRFK